MIKEASEEESGFTPTSLVKTPEFSLTRVGLEQAKHQIELLRQYCFEVLQEGSDYGSIPGTERTDPKTGEVTGKKVLHKPGAEKLCQFLRLYPRFKAITLMEDFEKPLFFYRYECDLIHMNSGQTVGSGIGSCNSYESKYRYRNQNRFCPQCHKETIIKGKKEYGGGWLCFQKKGGCGAKFVENDTAITGQITGRIENEDVYDLTNTIDKMAQKRALLSAVLVTAGVSEYFTQDLEDDVERTEMKKDATADLHIEMKTKLKETLNRLAKMDGTFTAEERLQELLDNPRAKLEHINRASTPEQIDKLEKALAYAEQALNDRLESKP